MFVNVATVLSLLLCMAVMFLWVRSYSGSDLVLWMRAWREGHGAGRKYVQVVSCFGKIYLHVEWGLVLGRESIQWQSFMQDAQRMDGGAEFRVARLVQQQPWDYQFPPQGGPVWSPIRWANWRYSDATDMTRESRLALHHWLVMVLFLIWPSVWAVGWWRKRRKEQNGLCGECGYDLRATPGRCPECGRANLSQEAVELEANALCDI
jgi:hypothetical protein